MINSQSLNNLIELPHLLVEGGGSSQSCPQLEMVCRLPLPFVLTFLSRHVLQNSYLNRVDLLIFLKIYFAKDILFCLLLSLQDDTG